MIYYIKHLMIKVNIFPHGLRIFAVSYFTYLFLIFSGF